MKSLYQNDKLIYGDPYIIENIKEWIKKYKLYDNKSTKSNKVNHMLTDEEKIKAFDGPKIIKVFARKVYIDNRKNLTKEQILITN